MRFLIVPVRETGHQESKDGTPIVRGAFGLASAYAFTV